MSIVDKIHLYDGWFYAYFVDKALKDIRNIISQLIPEKSRILDGACGTGALLFSIAHKCDYALGVDLSSKMILHAEKQKKVSAYTHLHFLHADSGKLGQLEDKAFDFVVFSMAIHEMPYETRLAVLEEASRLGKKLIIADYAIPMPKSRQAFFTRFIEFIAGWNHFTAFKDFEARNGIEPLLYQFKYKIISETLNSNKTIKVVLAELANER